MSFRTSENISLPFRVVPIVKVSQGVVDLRIIVKALFKPQFVANNVEVRDNIELLDSLFLTLIWCASLFSFVKVRIPLPKNTAQVNKLKDVRVGRAKYKSADNALVWRYALMIILLYRLFFCHFVSFPQSLFVYISSNCISLFLFSLSLCFFLYHFCFFLPSFSLMCD